MDSEELQMIEFAGPGEEMHVAFGESRQHRTAPGIDHPRAISLVGQRLSVAPHIGDLKPA